MSDRSPQDRFFTVNGIRLHVVDWGGEGPAALLFHATGFHGRVWDPIARELSRRFHVYACDARGHGDSEKPEAGYDWARFTEDAVALLETLGAREALCVGHSLGATIVASVAAERPDLCGRAVLLDVILFPREFRRLSEAENPMAIAARKRREIWPSRAEMVLSYGSRSPFESWRRDVLELYVHHGTEELADGTARLKCPARIEAQVFGMSSGFDGWGVLDRVSAPVLLVRGETSDTLSELDAARALGRLRRGRLATAPGSSHFIPMERPDWVVAEIDRFLSSAEPAPTLPVDTHGLAHVALKVRELEKARDFYREVFGMRIVWQPDRDNVYLSSGRDNLALHRADANGHATGALDHLGFLVSRPAKVYAAAEALERRGIPILQPPRRHRDGSCSLYVRDPDGNVVQILYTPDAKLE